MANDRTPGEWFKAGFFTTLGIMLAIALPQVIFFFYLMYLLQLSK